MIDWKTVPQRGEHLGQRMHHAFADAFAAGFEEVLLMGGDCPDLPPAVIEDAFIALKTHDMSLVPTQDGGYCLVGFRQTAYAPKVFHFKDWDSESVFSQTLCLAETENINLWVGPQWRDVDTRDDLRALLLRQADSEMSWFAESATLHYLRAWD